MPMVAISVTSRTTTTSKEQLLSDPISQREPRGNALARWLHWGLDRASVSMGGIQHTSLEDGSHRILAKGGAQAPGGKRLADHVQTLTVRRDGSIRFDNEFRLRAPLDDVPRIGVTFTLPAGFTDLEWFGRGPHENYWDRKRGAAIGRYRSMVREQYVPYIVPQEHGNHTDVLWFTLRSRDGSGLLIVGAQPLEFTASHFSAEDLFLAAHTSDLKPRKEVTVCIDWHQHGLGTGSCGPDTLDVYKIRRGTYSFSYIMAVIDKDDDPATLSRQLV